MRLRWLLILAATACTAQGLAGAAESSSTPDQTKVEFFEKKIRPLFIDNCYECHSANTNAQSGLRVDDRNGLIQGGKRGSAIVPGNPEKSLLLKAVAQTDSDLKMPPKKHLSAEQVAALTQWVRDGAAWPPDPVTIIVGAPNPKYDKLRREHWAWQPLHLAAAPLTRDRAWPRDDIDRFVLARLEEKGLKPARDASKVALIRRVTFDLTGLPPTPEEIDAFLADPSSGAFDNVVDRLLASPGFGERWGRHWLDVARYAESTGPSRNVPYPHAWRYRDYVIDSFNSDKPYDQFIREQIAGDLLPFANQQERDEHLVATGFLALGPHDVNQRFKTRFVMDNIDEQIDTMSRSILALTASCARCHDHKFDPIPTSDYYALAGIFYSTDLCAGVRNKMGGGGMDYYDTQMLLRLGPPDVIDPQRAAKIKAVQKQLADARAEMRMRGDKPVAAAKGPDGKPLPGLRQKIKKLENELLDLTDPAADGHAALGARDARVITDTEIRIRGEAERLGPVIPRGFFSLVQFPDQPAVDRTHSGRLELAEWLTKPQNPLTTRVIVNRVWEHLFGQGLVRSVDNFGTTGDVPTHPELLDHLAARFVEGGWSIKKLVRAVVLTRAYQLSSERVPANMAVDPADRLVWRHNPRRLEAEEIRDATLLASAKLDRSRPQASPAWDLKVKEMADNGADAARIKASGRASLHRSVYLPLLRGLTPISLEVFDFAQQGMVTGSRDATTVATQALYNLNDPFVRRQALNLADRLLAPADLDDSARIVLAYRLTLGRAPTSAEIARAKSYLAAYESTAGQVIASTPAPAEPRHIVAVADAGLKVAAESGESTSINGAAKKPVVPDEIVHVDTPVKDEIIQPASAKAAALASFCQALLGTAEFRYLK
jgi:mono/diheme cytochrome c family protein